SLQSPTPIARSDWEACHTGADATAQQRHDQYLETVKAAGPFGGPFGGTMFRLTAQARGVAGTIRPAGLGQARGRLRARDSAVPHEARLGGTDANSRVDSP